jgi:hypothetical protein
MRHADELMAFRDQAWIGMTALAGRSPAALLEYAALLGRLSADLEQLGHDTSNWSRSSARCGQSSMWVSVEKELTINGLAAPQLAPGGWRNLRRAMARYQRSRPNPVRAQAMRT